mmetsp:Transcript_2406/g.4854  ORF Transcript_2406/g.4854 Transcript_2406/m.4854 type:complete len:283 (+) Transcript_2406:1-849(+)
MHLLSDYEEWELNVECANSPLPDGVEPKVTKFLQKLNLQKYLPALAEQGVAKFAELEYVDEEIMDACGFSPIHKKVFARNRPTGAMPQARDCAAQAPNQPAIVHLQKAHDFPGLVEVLCTGDIACKSQAAQALSMLAQNNKVNQMAIACSGAVEPLVQLVSTGNAEGKSNAAWALRVLAEDNKDNQTVIMGAGVVEPLVHLLSTGSNGGRTCAAKALSRLAVNNDYRAAIANAGAIKPLVYLLSNGDAEEKSCVEKALDELARDNEDNQTAIAHAKKNLSLE